MEDDGGIHDKIDGTVDGGGLMLTTRVMLCPSTPSAQ